MADRKMVVRLLAETAGYSAGMKRAQQSTDTFSKQIDRAQGKTAGLGQGLAKVGNAFKIGFAAVASSAVLKVAADLDRLGIMMEATERRADTVFGEMSDDARRWVDDQNEAFGIGENALLGLAAATQDLLVPMGFAREEALGMSKDVLTTANALSEWTGGTIESADAQDRIIKAILGEREGLIPLGIKISELDVKNRLLAKGQDKLTGQALEQAKAMATLELITGKSTDALKAYEGRATTALAKQKQLDAAFADATETAGRWVREGLEEPKDAASDLITVLKFFEEQLKDTTDAQADADKGTRNWLETLNEWAKHPVANTLDFMADKIAEYEAAQAEAAETTARWGTSQDLWIVLAKRTAAATDNVAGAHRGAAAAVSEHLAAQIALTDQILADLNPVVGAVNAWQGMTAAQTAADDAAKKFGPNSREAAQAQLDLAVATGEAEAALIKLGGGNLERGIQAIADTLNISYNEANALLETLGLLDGRSVVTTITTRYITEQELVSLPGRNPNTVREARQHGGAVLPGHRYLVGERGRELFEPAVAGRIYSNPQSNAMLTAMNKMAAGATPTPRSTQITVNHPRTNDLFGDIQLALMMHSVTDAVEGRG